jgi:putative ABC transport system permease protein
MAGSRSLAAARRVVALCGWLVPSGFRAEWRREWEGELTAWHADGRPRLLRHAAGALADACWLRQRQVADVAWIDDLRHGWRQLHGQLTITATAIGVLALGMAASVAAFSVVSQVLLRPLPYPEPDRIVTLWERKPTSTERLDAAPGNFLDWRDRTRSFTAFAAAEPYSRDYTDGDRPEVWRAANVTPGFFEAFGLAPLHGRWFTADDYVPGRERVAILSAGVWRSRFAADPRIVGRRITLDGEPWDVIGVMPDNFAPGFFSGHPDGIMVWAPQIVEEFERRIRASGYWQVVARLAPGVTIAHGGADLAAIARQLEAEHPRTNRGAGVTVLPLREFLLGDVRRAVALFSGAVAVVLLIACVNVTNLLLARGAMRRQEMAVRAALGASRWRLLGQLLVESALLAGLAGAVGVVLAHGAIRGLIAVAPDGLAWIETLRIDGSAMLFAAALSALVTILAGLVPAIRLSTAGVAGVSSRTATGDRAQRRLRTTLVGAEVALALVLVSGGALLLRSFVTLVTADAGFRSAGVSVLQVFAWDRNVGSDRLRLFFDRAIAGLEGLPGVQAAGAVMAMPFIESNIDVQANFAVAGDPPPAPGEEPRASINRATPGYFAAMGIPVIRGRGLDDRDGPTSPPVAVVTEALAARYFSGRDPVGRRLTMRVEGKPVDLEIVGVVGAQRHERLDAPPRAEIIRPFAQSPSGSMTLVARTATPPGPFIESAKQAIWAVDPLQTFHRTASLDELVGRTVSARRFALIVLTGFAAIALLLAALGLYGVLTAVALQYRREIGVRMAVGARAIDILRLVVARGLLVVAAGLAVGLAGALGGARLLQPYLVDVTARDPWAIGGAALLLLAVAMPACLLPAARASRTSPTEVLRVD